MSIYLGQYAYFWNANKCQWDVNVKEEAQLSELVYLATVQIEGISN